MSTICPDNSTECLLRALLDAQSGFDWDPLSFAFTAAIGVLALIVAGVTVFQGLLSAGPGRLKASKGAIGIYAAKTTTRFHWDELRYRTTAKVPFITELHLLEATDHTKLSQDVRMYPARWVTLLEAACLSAEKAPDVEVITDHLPADIAAPAAWTTVSNAVRLACIAGCNVITTDQNSIYPKVRGPTCQLRFREHPDLGTVAVFDLFVKKRYYPFDSDEKLLQEIRNENLEGSIAYNEIFSMSLKLEYQIFLPSLKLRCNSCRHQLCYNFLTDNYWNLNVLTVEASTSAKEFSGLGAVFGPMLARIPVSPRVANLTEGTDGLLSMLNKLLEAQYDDEQTMGFPRLEKFKIDSELAKLKGLGARYIEGVVTNDRDLGWSWIYPFDNSRHRPDIGLPDYPVGEPNIRIVPLVLEWVRKHTLIEPSESTVPPVNVLHMRYLLQFQLREVDWWLLNHGGPGAACEVIAFAWDVAKRAQPLFSDRDLKQIPEDNAAPKEGKVNISETVVEGEEQSEELNKERKKKHKKRKSDKEQRKKLREILMFRATVWILYIRTATDISSVLDNEVGDRMVQLL